MFRIVQIFLVLSLIPIILGCSGSGNPVQPDQIIPTAPASIAASNRILWGLWTVSIDPYSGTAEVLPDRIANLHLNAVRLIEVNPCTDCLRIKNFQLISEYELQVDLELRHPFPGAKKYTAFDVRGIFISGADFPFPESGRAVSLAGDFPRLLNPDGYTQLFNPTDFPPTAPAALGYIEGKYSSGGDLSATLNPYLAYELDEPRCMFGAGLTRSRTVRIRIPSAPIEFGYAVDACWQLVDEVNDPVVDFPLDANCLEAYRINVTIGDGLTMSTGSQTEITAEIFDHQGFETISIVTAEAPDLFDGIIDLSFREQTSDESWMFEGILRRFHEVSIGEYPVLVRVIDWDPDQNLGQIDSWQVAGVSVGHGIGWARTWGGWKNEFGHGIAVDEFGNIFVCGTFSETADLDPGPGTDNHTAMGYSDVFLSRFTRDGEFLWSHTWGGLRYDRAWQIALDDAGYVYVTGEFSGDVDFDPGPGSDIHISIGDGDIYVSKFDTEGNFIWARTWGGEGADRGRALVIDALGNVYVTGYFKWEADFDPGPDQDIRESIGELDAYLSKLDPDGNLVWAITWGCPSNAYPDAGMGIALDASGNPHIVGYFGDSTDFDPGPDEDIRSCNGMSDAFLVKFNSDGKYAWARTWGGLGSDCPSDIAIDNTGNIYITGYFTFAADFDPGPGEDIHDCIGGCDAFISGFDSEGFFLWACTWGSENSNTDADGVAVDESGNPYVTGDFRREVDFDPGPGENFVASQGNDDCYLSMFDSTGNHMWVHTWGSEQSDHSYSIELDNSGSLYVTGAFETMVDFDPGPGIDMHTSAGWYDAFLLKLGPDGYW